MKSTVSFPPTPPPVSPAAASGGQLIRSRDETSAHVDPVTGPSRGRLGRGVRSVRRAFHGLFCWVSLVALLSALAAVPGLQLVTRGYLLHVAGSIASGSTVKESLPGIRQAGTVGLAAVALFVASLPSKLLVDWATVAPLVNPETTVAVALRIAAVITAAVTLAYLLWAWIRGGRLLHYLWPQPIRLARQAWRPSTWSDAADRLWEFTASFEVPRMLSLGVRGAIGTLVWLIPAMLIIAANRN